MGSPRHPTGIHEDAKTLQAAYVNRRLLDTSVTDVSSDPVHDFVLNELRSAEGNLDLHWLNSPREVTRALGELQRSSTDGTLLIRMLASHLGPREESSFGRPQRDMPPCVRA